MSLKLHKYIENAIEKKNDLLNAEILNFPTNEKKKFSKDLSFQNKSYWKISDSSNYDQLKAVTGICLTLGFLFVIGLFANFNLI